MRFPSACVAIVLAATIAVPDGRSQGPEPAPGAAAPADMVAIRSVIVGAGGPRGGEKPARYFNVQGAESRGDKKYSSFGVLDFAASDRLVEALGEAGDAPKITLVLTQSIPPFARPGRVTLWLATDPALDLGALRFVEGGDGPLGAAAESCVRCGAWDFAVGKTGQEDRIVVDLPQGAKKAILAENAGRTMRLIVIPDEAGVAATWFGTDQTEVGHRPRLVVD